MSNKLKSDLGFGDDSDDDWEKYLDEIEEKKVKTGKSPQKEQASRELALSELDTMGVKSSRKQTSYGPNLGLISDNFESSYNLSDDDKTSLNLESNDIDMSEQQSKNPTKTLEQMLKQIKDDTARKLEKQKKQLEREFQIELEKRQNDLEEEKRRQKELWDKQLEVLEATAKQQERLQLLQENISANSISLSQMAMQFQSEKSQTDIKKESEVSQLQFIIQQREAKIQSQESSIEQEKAWLELQFQQAEENERSRAKQHQIQLQQLADERRHIHEFKQMLVKQENEKKKEYELATRKIQLLQEALSKDKSSLQKDKANKLNEYQFELSLIRKQQDEISKSIEEERKSLQHKRDSVANTTREISTEEQALIKEVQQLEAKEKKLHEDWEAYQIALADLESQKSAFEEQAYNIYQLSLSNHANSEQLQEQKEAIVQCKLDIEKGRAEIAQLHAASKSESALADELTTEVRIRTKTYEQLRLNTIRESSTWKEQLYEQVSKDYEIRSYSIEEIPYERPSSRPYTSEHLVETDKTGSFTSNYPSVQFPNELSSVTATASAPRFSSQAYMKSLEELYKERTSLQEFMENQENYLIQSKLQIESSLNSSLAESIKPRESPRLTESELQDVQKINMLWTFGRRLFRHSPMLQRVETFFIPQPGEGIVEVEILAWLVKPGDQVKEYDILCEGRSDKGFIEYKSPFDGTIVETLGKVQEMSAIGQPLYKIEIDDLQYPTKQEKRGAPSSVASQEKHDPKVKPDGKVLASPAVRHLAKQYDINLTDLVGTGPGGRITKEDVLSYFQQPPPAEPKKTQKVEKSAGTVESEGYRIKITPTQRGMVKSMTKSLQIPHLTYMEDVYIDKLIEIRKEVMKLLDPTKKITFMPFFLKALSMAIHDYPIVNSSLSENLNEYVQYTSHNISIAMDTPIGLLVPSLKNVQNMSLVNIADALVRLQSLGQQGRLSDEDLLGGTIGFSNIGTIGGKYTRPVILPPQVMIGAVGGMQTTLVLKDGEVKERKYLCSSWSADHRLIDGATVARFVKRWKEILENPSLMLLNLRQVAQSFIFSTLAPKPF